MNPVLFKGWMFILKRLPLLWQCSLMTNHLKFKTYKAETKDKLFGELKVCIISVDKDWEWYPTEYDSYRIRDVTYCLKRSRLPWSSTPISNGTQLRDETAHPLKRLPHPTVIATLDKVASMVHKHNAHKALKAAFDNPAKTEWQK